MLSPEPKSIISDLPLYKKPHLGEPVEMALETAIMDMSFSNALESKSVLIQGVIC